NQADSFTLLDLVIETKLCQSKSRGRTDIESGAIYINDQRHTDISLQINSMDTLFNKYILLRKGKKNYHLVILV
ncbi:MAG: tyrosine--tRNA ligase, partial [Peptococcaceae bacterium]|nr:tyrosine--tRNA ligase [Peptococcaceae bacterium]